MRTTLRFRLPTAAALSVGLLLSGCGPDADIVIPSIVETRPPPGGQWPADEPLEVHFDGWLDPQTVDDRVAELTSGELSATVTVEYDPVAPGLVVRPLFGLRPGLGYVLTVDGEAVSALGGEPGAGVTTVGFRAGPPSGWLPPPVPSDAEMQALFAERCGCHGPDQAVFPTLDRAGLVGVTSRRQPDRALVVPGRPMRSLLVLKVLDAYPGVRGMQKALTDAERRQIVRWVRGL